MKRFLSLLMVCMLLAGLCTVGASAAETKTLVAKESQWQYLVYEDTAATAPEGWLNGTDSETWTTAQAPFTGTSYPNAIAKTTFEYGSYTAFLRTTFTLKDASAIKDLVLSVIWDEDPVVYINGTEVWSATGYQDKSYTDVSLVDKISTLKSGTNYITVKYGNAVGGGGSVFDLALTASEEIVTVDSNGNVLGTASCEGFADFGAMNAASNILDGDQTTVCGSAWSEDTTQSVTLTFKQATTINKVFVQCKDEGTTTNANGTRGTYDIYAIAANGTETKIGSNVPAITGTDGGYTLGLSTPVEAAAVKVVITSWQGDCWACVADLAVTAGTASASGSTTATPSAPTTGDAVVYATVAMAAALIALAVIVRKIHA